MSSFPENLSYFVFENITPLVNNGEYPLKKEPGDEVIVEADIFRTGHEKIGARLIYRKQGDSAWKKSPMEHVNNDLWRGSFKVDQIGFYEYGLEAWTLPDKRKVTRFEKTFKVRVDPIYARFSTWYEMFPRSQGKYDDRSATWYDCIERLNDIKNMGFDTIYLVPIHPIGKKNRKGKNNSLKALDGEPGSPYAVGNEHGGHYAVDPDIGTMEEFEEFVKACKKHGFKLALDIALNSSPDHPHVKEHPEWFCYEKDGTIKCAENPPKKYEDIYPYDFFNPKWKELWTEIRNIILFWADKGFTFFRIDNPHTKPFIFWEWLINDIKKKRPELVFLSEAFTRPKVMHRLAKLGFDMSYTYFTWRNEKWELEEYFKELTSSPAKEYMRGMLFPTTPDILPIILQNAPREAFTMRAFLAATLSSLFGMYNGYELCETVPYPGKEELLDSEKYQYKARDWDAPGNVKSFIKTLNQIRNNYPAFHEYDNLFFHYCENREIMAYSKVDKRSGCKMLCIVNLDVKNTQSGWVDLDVGALGLEHSREYLVKDVLNNDETYRWQGGRNFVILDPKKRPGHIFQIIEEHPESIEL
ncbi:MAG: alpha-1,4-glucan--maltose-1-phosphate maltosyltransferase [Fibrobacter sp.]|jgi:starch synthase (maltosyl-transferring)|nr:alpha-1,4-glucan--maltose-1-phosphate maltosyltransferase [Fibrobacter sp.]